MQLRRKKAKRRHSEKSAAADDEEPLFFGVEPLLNVNQIFYLALFGS
jgi:hypothetical protein